ncbi:unnamed protein product [Auanema sp. JU1783]|nr:unnamed protein product [Auanema sp. JU1783]
MINTFLLLLLPIVVSSSPTFCHCPSGSYGMTCPNPIQLNCPPAPQCPPAPPCNPFPTLPPFDHNNAIQGIAQFTFPTLAPIGQGLGQATPAPVTPLPLPVAPPSNGQESLLLIGSPAASQVPPPPPPPPVPAAPLPTYPQQPYQTQPVQVSVQASPQYVEAPVDATTKATTLAGELYVEAESPEEPTLQNTGTVFENEPNNGFRQPVKRDSDGDSTLLTDKCNDKRLKKIIEENCDSNPSSSKRKIQKAATEEIGGLFDVICSSHDFSYLANTQLFCEAGNEDVTCFAFLHSIIQ